jgi:CheY-like chemotaxis protein
MAAEVTATILVVEDDPDVRKVATAQLGSLGYTVIEARDAASALDILRSDRTIDMLFTDVMMPGDLSGLDLGRTAQELRPGLAVLYTSGFTETSLQDDGQIEDIRDRLIPKPYRLRDLARKVSEVLAARKIAGA